MFRILQMFKNVQGPITVNVLTYTCGKMSGSFTDIAGTTARTQKLVYHTRTEPTRDSILHTEHAADFKRWESNQIQASWELQFDVQEVVR